MSRASEASGVYFNDLGGVSIVKIVNILIRLDNNKEASLRSYNRGF